MHLPLPIPTALLLLLLPFQTISSPAPLAEAEAEAEAEANPAPLPKTLAQITGPISVPQLSLGTGVQTPTGNTRVYYQAADSAIHELVGNGYPGQNRVVYNDQIVLPIGKARIGTPIAVVDLATNLALHLFYVSPDDKLREYYYDNRWRDGALNAANITTRAGSRYLWAISAPGSGRPRVGYVAANGDLSEVAWDGNEWDRYVY